MKTIITLTPDQQELLKTLGNFRLDADETLYLNLPQWFKSTDKENIFEILMPWEIPAEKIQNAYMGCFSASHNGVVHYDDLTPVSVEIIIEPHPKVMGVVGYVNEGKNSYPSVYMLIKHHQSGETLICTSVDKSKPYRHLIKLSVKSKGDKLPQILGDDTFSSAGFVMPEKELNRIKDFKSIRFEQ